MENTLDSILKNLLYIEPSELVFLCGAGISLDSPSSLPTVNTFVSNILQHCGLEDSILQKVYAQFGQTNYRFEALVDEIQKKYDHTLHLANLFHSSSYNKLHCFLGKMLEHGSSVITTNFDNCIENACSPGLLQHQSKRIVYHGDDLKVCQRDSEGMLVKVHGSHLWEDDEKQALVITLRALAKTDRAFSLLPNWKRYLKKVLQDKILVVLGYSCSDDFDVVPLIKESGVKRIVWLNYNPGILLPAPDTATNKNILELGRIFPLRYYSGQLVPYLEKWSSQQGFALLEGEKIPTYTVEQYITQIYPTREKKTALVNELLLIYGLYEEVLDGSAPEVLIQNIKSQFRQGNYSNVILRCDALRKIPCSRLIRKERDYYLASAYYASGNYTDSLKIARKCIFLGYNDTIYYLNALINYSSILFVYAASLPERKQAFPLWKVEQTYKKVLKASDGVSLETKANALWGLGELARYQDNPEKARQLLSQALLILEHIGNTFAIHQLKDIMDKMQ